MTPHPARVPVPRAPQLEDHSQHWSHFLFTEQKGLWFTDEETEEKWSVQGQLGWDFSPHLQSWAERFGGWGSAWVNSGHTGRKSSANIPRNQEGGSEDANVNWH